VPRALKRPRRVARYRALVGARGNPRDLDVVASDDSTGVGWVGSDVRRVAVLISINNTLQSAGARPGTRKVKGISRSAVGRLGRRYYSVGIGAPRDIAGEDR
jgi:hypothetical protein